MAKTPSNMPPLGLVAPDFSLPTPDGTLVARDDFKGKKGLLVIFMCNHCPFVAHLEKALAAFTRNCMERGLGVVGINANDIALYPEDSPRKMAEKIISAGYPFPYVFDATQNVARAYKAACTPDFFLFDADFKLVYRGRFDDSTPGNHKPITGSDLHAAVETLLTHTPNAREQFPSIGCNIKWKL